jgi:excisionase family DNA binding protein
VLVRGLLAFSIVCGQVPSSEDKPQMTAPTSQRSNRAQRRAEQFGRRYATINETAEYLGITGRTVRQMIADGRLTGYRSGARLVRLDLNQVDAAMTPFGGGD